MVACRRHTSTDPAQSAMVACWSSAACCPTWYCIAKSDTADKKERDTHYSDTADYIDIDICDTHYSDTADYIDFDTYTAFCYSPADHIDIVLAPCR